MASLLSELDSVLKQSLELKNKYFDGYKMDLDHVTLFTYDQESYDQLNEKARALGELEKEDERGSFYKLNNPFKVEGYDLTHFKVAKPNIHNHSQHKCGVYYKVEDYDDFKKNFNSITDEKVVKQQLPNKSEILKIDTDVVLYVIPANTPEVEDIEAALERTAEEKDLERLKAQLSEEQMKRIQVMADFQNYQKRIEQEKKTWGAVSNMGLVREMLEVYDDLHLALNDENLNLEHAKVSIKSAQDKLITAVSTVGIEVIEVNIGDEFDKEKMEAVSTISAGEEQKNKVIAVISSAYKYKDREFILKPAKVVVGK